MRTAACVLLMCFASAALAQFASEAPVLSTEPVATPKHLVAQTPSKKVKQTTAPNESSARQIRPNSPAVKVPIEPPPSEVTRQLYQAIASGNFSLADVLIQRGGDINCKNCTADRGSVLMKMDATSGQEANPAIRWLLDRGADPDLQDSNGRTVLMQRAKMGMNHVWSEPADLDILLRYGANPNLHDHKGMTALHLLASGTPPTQMNSMTIEYLEGMEQAYERSFQKLLSAGADINSVNNFGVTPLMLASGACNPRVVEMYLAAGASPQAKAGNGLTAVDGAMAVAIKKADRACNQTLAVLEAAATNPAAHEQSPGKTGKSSPAAASIADLRGDWRGVFNAVKPHEGTARVDALVSETGDISFKSQFGLRGSGQLKGSAGSFSGEILAALPLDDQGRPLVKAPGGAKEVTFKISGTLNQGVLRGRYSSSIESGGFVMCDKESAQPVSECSPPAVDVGSVFRAIGQLLGNPGG